MSSFRPFEVVGRGSETQLQMGENVFFHCSTLIRGSRLGDLDILISQFINIPIFMIFVFADMHGCIKSMIVEYNAL